MSSIGSRLKEERQRLGVSQPALANIGGVSKNTQVGYEKDTSHPDATYLAAVANAGVDFIYVVIGKRLEELTHGLSPEEMKVLSLWRGLNDSDKETIVRTLSAFSSTGLSV
jgi:transcriptional regulator with XRE-family HTH domain